MSRDPVLAVKTLPLGDGYRVPRTLRVEGGLHYIKGNNQPYFSLTCEVHRKGFRSQCQSGGADHALILKHFPKYADLAALHSSGIDGEPMHAEANGWFWLAGALGGMGERYHGGNSKIHVEVTPPTDKPWATTEYREPTVGECLAIFAGYCRISLEKASTIRDRCAAATLSNDWSQDVHRAKAARDVWKRYVETLRPIWKRQADDCIARHHLVVYGDAWGA